MKYKKDLLKTPNNRNYYGMFTLDVLFAKIELIL